MVEKGRVTRDATYECALIKWLRVGTAVSHNMDMVKLMRLFVPNFDTHRCIPPLSVFVKNPSLRHGTSKAVGITNAHTRNSGVG